MSRKTHKRLTHRSKSHKRLTHRSKSHKRRHSRKHSRKNGGACPCSMRTSGGSKASQKRRQTRLAKEDIERNAQRMVNVTERLAILSTIAHNAANEGSRRGQKRMTANRHNKFKKHLLLVCHLIM